MLLVATLLSLATAGTNVAICGGKTDFFDPALIKPTTPWKLLPAANATAAQVASAAVFIETPLDMLGSATAAKLYHFAYTGYSEDELAQIPSRLTVCNCHQSSVPIAEYVIAALLEWNIQLRQTDAMMHNCTWRSAPPGNTCRGKPHRQAFGQTLGILGYGHIGEAIATRAAALGMRVIATRGHPPAGPPPKPLAWLGDDSKNPQLFGEAHFVVVATPLSNSTRGLVDASLLGDMKDDGVLINIARGAVVDEAALYAALSAGRIGGAVLDVWWSYGYLKPGGVGPDSWPSAYRFDELPNVLMSPHSSGDTPGSAVEGAKEIAANLDAFAEGRPLINVVRPGQP